MVIDRHTVRRNPSRNGLRLLANEGLMERIFVSSENPRLLEVCRGLTPAIARSAAVRVCVDHALSTFAINGAITRAIHHHAFEAFDFLWDLPSVYRVRDLVDFLTTALSCNNWHCVVKLYDRHTSSLARELYVNSAKMGACQMRKARKLIGNSSLISSIEMDNAAYVAGNAGQLSSCKYLYWSMSPKKRKTRGQSILVSCVQGAIKGVQIDVCDWGIGQMHSHGCLDTDVFYNELFVMAAGRGKSKVCVELIERGKVICSWLHMQLACTNAIYTGDLQTCRVLHQSGAAINYNVIKTVLTFATDKHPPNNVGLVLDFLFEKLQFGMLVPEEMDWVVSFLIQNKFEAAAIRCIDMGANPIKTAWLAVSHGATEVLDASLTAAEISNMEVDGRSLFNQAYSCGFPVFCDYLYRRLHLI